MASTRKLLREEAGVKLFEIGEQKPMAGPMAVTMYFHHASEPTACACGPNRGRKRIRPGGHRLAFGPRCPAANRLTLRKTRMHKTAMERAFELARSGRFKVSKDIDRTLKSEGYNNVEVAFLTLPSVRRELLRTCRSAVKPLGEPNATPAKSDVAI